MNNLSPNITTFNPDPFEGLIEKRSYGASKNNRYSFVVKEKDAEVMVFQITYSSKMEYNWIDI